MSSWKTASKEDTLLYLRYHAADACPKLPGMAVLVVNLTEPESPNADDKTVGKELEKRLKAAVGGVDTRDMTLDQIKKVLEITCELTLEILRS